MGRFSRFDEDAYRLPEGMQRIAYDADTQQYTFRDQSGRLYESAPGCRYGVLEPVAAAPPVHRRNVTITEIPDPTLRQWSKNPAKTFDDILPQGYITAAQSGVQESPTCALAPGEKWAQAVVPKVKGVVEVVRRHTSMRRPSKTATAPVTGTGAETGVWRWARSGTWKGTWNVKRMDSLVEEKGRLLEGKEDGDGDWVVVQRSGAVGGGLARFKSETRPSRYAGRK